MKKVLKYSLAILIWVISSCTYQNEEEVFGTIDADPGSGGGNSEPVSLMNDIVPLMNLKCAISGCHNGSRFPNLSVKANIISNASSIKSRTRVGGGMPRNGTLTTAQRDLIADWVDGGALDN
ncbi:MAG: hypothetical protein JXQ96_22195 [Cyclobacteriaceae bacterium]